jgi:outer membrane receptor protein involved in Fe transport
MKPTHALQSLLLSTACLVAPAVAFAQATPDQPAPTAPAAEAPAEEPRQEEVVIVRGRFIPEPMRTTSEVLTVLSSADLARQGDDNAAAALTRLAGLSVANSKFVFVRGLGDRYSSALLNGSPLPSPEPLRRTVPLDLFPSNILSGANVQKTFTPNYPGEFGGGIIDLTTLRKPNENFFSAKASLSANTESTGQRALSYYGGENDVVGFDDGTRRLPGPLAAVVARPVLLGNAGLTDRQLEAVGESLINSPLSVIQERDGPAGVELEFSGGASLDRGDLTIGLIGVVGYDSGWTTRVATRQIGTAAIPLGRDQVSTATSWDVTLNTLGSLSVSWPDHEVALTGFLVRDSSKEAQMVRGFDFNVPANAAGQNIGASEATAWYERALASLQIAGQHQFEALEVRWRAAHAVSTRDAPYERSVGFLVDERGEQFYGRSNNNTTRFSSLTDTVSSAGLDLKWTLDLAGGREATLSGGLAWSQNDREYDLLQFLFGGGAGLPADVARARVDFLFSVDNIAPSRFVLLELTGPDDSYDGDLGVMGAYVAADVEISSFLRASVGVRHEEGEQNVATRNRFGAPTTAPTRIENAYWLPAATLTWNFADDLQMRLGASKTIARPQFRELAVSPYIDPDSDRTYRGNPFLLDSELTNYDVRVEYYFGRNQFITGGLFYKEILNPIEEVQSETSTLSFLTTFINAPRATLAGVELDHRINFEMPWKLAWLDGKEFFFAANYTYTKTEVQASSGDLVFDPLRIGARRPASDFALDGAKLQGASEHLANLQFGWETDAEQLTLLVAYTGERITQRGLGGLSDVVETPGVNLDLVWRRDLKIAGKDFTLGLSGRNLLNTRQLETIKTDAGELDFNSYDRGASFSISLSTRG